MTLAGLGRALDRVADRLRLERERRDVGMAADGA